METRKDLTKKISHFTVKRIAMLSILTALCYVGRIVFQFLPNVQPMTTILLIITLTLGVADGLIVAMASLILSNMVLGMGPWIFYQMLTYAIIMIITAFVIKPLYEKKKSRLIFIVYSFLSGILFGFIISIFSAKLYGVSSFWAYYVVGIPFDLFHAAGNAGFYIILEPIIAPIMLKNKDRFHLN